MKNPRRNVPGPSKPGVAGPSPAGRTPFPPLPRDAESRFRLFVDARKPGDCWPWLGARNDAGYGTFGGGGRGREKLAHRFAFALVNGPIAPGAHIRHACNHPWCVNPKHLRSGTAADNMRDKVLAGRQAKGSQNGRAKLDEQTARQALRRMANGERKTDLAREYGVSRRALRFLESGAKWKHVHANPMQQRFAIGAVR